MLARKYLVFVFDLADIEVVAQEVVERAAAERDAAARCSCREPLEFSLDVAFPEIADQLVDAAEFEVPPKDKPDTFGFFLDNGNLAVL